MSNTTINGQLQSFRVVTSSGWGFGVVKATDRDYRVVGTWLNVTAGDAVTAVGEMVTHPKFGEQLKAISIQPAKLDNNDGVVAWLCARIPFIGEARAQELVARWPGDELWRVIEKTPDALNGIKGLTPKRVAQIRDAYREHKAEREVMVQLKQFGLTDNQVGYCLGAIGRADDPPITRLRLVVDKVSADPYWLSEHVHGFGFARADEVARRIGIATDSPVRIAAGIKHVLTERKSSGDVYVWGAALEKMASRGLGVDSKLVAPIARAMAIEGRISITNGGRVYLPAMARAEACVVEHFSRLSAANDTAQVA